MVDLALPVEISPALRHLEILLKCRLVAFGYINRVSGNLGCNNSPAHVIHIRKSKMFSSVVSNWTAASSGP